MSRKSLLTLFALPAILLCLGAISAPAQVAVTYGGVQSSVGTGLVQPDGVAVDPATGNLFIADSGASQVVEITPDGTQTTLWSGTARTLAVNAMGEMILGTNQCVAVGGLVEIPSVYANQVTSMPLCDYWTQEAPTGVGVALDPNGNVFWASSHPYGSSSLVIEDPAPNFSDCNVDGRVEIGDPFYPGYWQLPYGIAVDANCDLVVADTLNNQVVEFQAGGTAQLVGTGLNEPTAVALDGSGNVYILDLGNSRVVEVQGSSQTTLASGLSFNALGGLTYGIAVYGSNVYFSQNAGTPHRSGKGRTPQGSGNGLTQVQLGPVNFGSATVGQSPQPVTFTYNVQVTTTFGNPQTVTQGFSNLDFTIPNGGNTCTGTITAGNTCTVTVSFTPQTPGPRSGAVQLYDNSGNLLITTPIYGEGLGPVPAFSPVTPTPFTANGLVSPTAMAVDPAGNIYVADYAGNQVVEFLANGGTKTVITGLGNPSGVALDGAGDLFIADPGNGNVAEILGGCTSGNCTITVNTGNYQLSAPSGVAVDAIGDLFIADAGGQVIEVPSGCGTGNCQSQAVGTGWQQPTGIAVDSSGNVYVADVALNQVVEVLASGGQTIVNTQNYTLSTPTGVAVDAAGDVFIADSNNTRVLEVPSGCTGPACPTVLNTGSYTLGIVSLGVSVDSLGDVFISDQLNDIVLELKDSQAPPLTFANTNLGSTANSQTVTLANSGNAALTFTSIAITGANSGDFAQTNNCGTSINSGASCAINVTFTPTAAGLRSAAVTFTDNSSSGTQTINLTGTGVAISTGTLNVSPATLGFGNEAITFTSASKNITLTNKTSAVVSLASLSFGGANGGDFSQTATTCGSTLAVNKSCTVSIAFTPTGVGAESATLTVTDSAGNSPQTVNLTGSGIVDQALSPTSLTFPAQAVNTISVPKTLTLTNNEPAAFTLGTMAWTGNNPGDFAVSNDCGGVVPAEGKCILAVTFIPSNLGGESVTLTISNISQSVSMTGTGINDASVAPMALTFPAQAVSTTSAGKTVKLTNYEPSPLPFTTTISGANSADFTPSNNCNGTVAANSTCMISVTFKPSIIGAESATLSITDSANTSPQTVTLTGTGANDATVAPAALTFPAQAVFSISAAETVTLTNDEPSSLSFSTATSGANGADFTPSNNCSGTVAAKSTCTISVTFEPSIIGAESATLSITDSANTSPQTVTLKGTGEVQVSLAPTSLTFAAQAVQTSAAKTITFTNNLPSALPFTPSFSGTNAGDFATSNNCSSSVPANNKCTITVTFTPSTQTTESATLSISDSANTSPQTISLAGTGEAQVVVSPTTLNFGVIAVEGDSLAKTVTVTNNLATALTIDSITLTDGADFLQKNTCGNSVAAKSKCTINVTFAPQVGGPLNSTLTITDSANTSPQTVSLTGTGRLIGSGGSKY